MTTAQAHSESPLPHGTRLRMASCQAPNSEYILAMVADYLSERLQGMATGGQGEVPGPAIEVERELTWQERYTTLLSGETQIAWICGAPYVRRRSEGVALRLLAAPVWRAPRYLDQPIYFSDVVVRAEHPAQTLADLRGAHVGINERGSYSGYEALRAELAALGETTGYFGAVTVTGSHQDSLRLILAGEIETAAIDSTVLEEEVRRRPELTRRLRIVHALGPAPMPPWVASPHLDPAVADAVQALLLAMDSTPDGRRVLAQTPVARFAAVNDGTYDPIRTRLAAAEPVQL